jgi:hypothetical protein
MEDTRRCALAVTLLQVKDRRSGRGSKALPDTQIHQASRPGLGQALAGLRRTAAEAMSGNVD